MMVARRLVVLCASASALVAPARRLGAVRRASAPALASSTALAGSLKPFLSTLIEGSDLSFDESRELFSAFLDGSAAPEEVAAVLCCLRQKGESFEEVAGAATAMRDACVRVDAPGTLLDIVGTGGDGACTINLSTCSAILAAACGAKVTKCGNRSVSSACGAADVLEALGTPPRVVSSSHPPPPRVKDKNLGLDLELDLGDVTDCIEAVGLGFLYAPNRAGKGCDSGQLQRLLSRSFSTRFG